MSFLPGPQGCSYPLDGQRVPSDLGLQLVEARGWRGGSVPQLMVGSGTSERSRTGCAGSPWCWWWSPGTQAVLGLQEGSPAGPVASSWDVAAGNTYRNREAGKTLELGPNVCTGPNSEARLIAGESPCVSGWVGAGYVSRSKTQAQTVGRLIPHRRHRRRRHWCFTVKSKDAK